MEKIKNTHKKQETEISAHAVLLPLTRVSAQGQPYDIVAITNSVLNFLQPIRLKQKVKKTRVLRDVTDKCCVGTLFLCLQHCGPASHLLLSHWHNKRKAARPTKPGRRRGKGRGRGRDSGEKKQKQKETEGSKENCICCRSCQWVVKTWLPSLPTIPFSFFSSFLPPVPETCDISGPLMCTTDR